MATFSSKNAQLLITDAGAGHVSQNGATTAASGTTNVYPLNAEFAAGSGDAATQFITDVTGYKAFTVDILDDVAIAANESLMVCWSTTADDESNTTTLLDSLRTALTTPDGAGYANCLVITERTTQLPVVIWDGVTTIKTISVATQGTANKNVVVRTVE